MKITIELEETQMRLLYESIKHDAVTQPELQKIALVIKNAIKVEVLIDNKVTMLLSQITGIPCKSIINSDELGFHLGIGSSRKKFLAKSLQTITRQFKPFARITLQEVIVLETVQDCIDLIKNKTA